MIHPRGGRAVSACSGPFVGGAVRRRMCDPVASFAILGWRSAIQKNPSLARTTAFAPQSGALGVPTGLHVTGPTGCKVVEGNLRAIVRTLPAPLWVSEKYAKYTSSPSAKSRQGT